MEDVRYSVLYAGQEPELARWLELLQRGIKVIWFGASCGEIDREIKEKKDEEHRLLFAFREAGYLCIYDNPRNVRLTVADGMIGGSSLTEQDEEQILGLGKDSPLGDPHFNAEQYLVEHASAEGHYIVKAGAGAGKTKVMIDRILFLMSMVDGLRMQDIVMLTFTNEATASMKRNSCRN